MSGIVILMLAAGTSHVILLLKFFVIQIPNAMGQGSEIALRRRLNDYNVALGWLAKFNVSIFLRLKALQLTSDICMSRKFSFFSAT